MSEIAVVLILALIFLGPKKLPELASGLGKMIREIKKVTAGVKEEIQLDENVRKPFEELREALTLPAEELKRRDEWKAEWEKRQQDEAAQLAAQADEAPAEAPSHESHMSHEPAHGSDGVAPSAGLEGFAGANGSPNDTLAVAGASEPAAKDKGDAAFANTAFLPPKPRGAVVPQSIAQVSAPPLADKTIIAPTPTPGDTMAATLPITATSVPGAATVPVPATGSGAAGPSVAAVGRTTMLGVSPAGTVPRPRPTPPPPPPAAARLPAPKVPGRVVPAPEQAVVAESGSETDKKA